MSFPTEVMMESNLFHSACTISSLFLKSGFSEKPRKHRKTLGCIFTVTAFLFTVTSPPHFLECSTHTSKPTRLKKETTTTYTGKRSNREVKSTPLSNGKFFHHVCLHGVISASDLSHSLTFSLHRICPPQQINLFHLCLNRYIRTVATCVVS